VQQPFRQISVLALHALPQLPQLLSLNVRSVQVFEQQPWPIVHVEPPQSTTHEPRLPCGWQLSPMAALQTLPH